MNVARNLIYIKQWLSVLYEVNNYFIFASSCFALLHDTARALPSTGSADVNAIKIESYCLSLRILGKIRHIQASLFDAENEWGRL
jgi:hypothetical protein